MERVRPSGGWLAATGCYVGLVAALTWSWVRSDAEGFKAAELASILLLLPVALVALPVAYVLLAGAWNLAGSEASQGSTPTFVVAAYVVVFAAMALANAVFVTAGVRVLRRRRP